MKCKRGVIAVKFPYVQTIKKRKKRGPDFTKRAVKGWTFGLDELKKRIALIK